MARQSVGSRESADAVMSAAQKKYPPFGDMLRAKRMATGMSLREYARRTGYSVSYLHDVELGRRPPFFGGDLRKMLDVINCTEQERFEFSVAETVSRGTIDTSDLSHEDIAALVAMRDGLRKAAKKQ